MARQFLADNNGWLSFNHSTPTLYVTAEDDDFDIETLRAWRAEGFNVKYVPMGNGGKTYVNTLHHLGDNMGIGERYAIVAFGDAAAVCLEVYSEPKTATSKLCSLVAYYPSTIPDPKRRLSSSFRVLVHLAQGSHDGVTVGVSRRHEALGIQGKRRTVQKRITPGIGAGGLQSKIEYPVYTYEGVDAGFAEHDLPDEYDAVADALAWSRSLSVVRRGFGAEVDLERVWEENVEHKYHAKNVQKIMETYTTEPKPFINFTPTLTGGHDSAEIRRFYKDYFLPNAPDSLHMRLISRTVGTDRIVDELYIQFKHTCHMPWVLPSVSPTNKKVEIVVISIVGMRGGKVWSERMYWDQASVLFQVGLLDPDLVPEEFKGRDDGLEMLPVAGSEAARKVMDFESEESNDMIDDW